MSESKFGAIKIPESSINISRLGFGCARLFSGGESKRSARLLEAALEAGITHFDTAPSYAYGQSEEIVGQVLSGVTDVTITTKVGIEPSGEPTRAGALYRSLVRPILSKSPQLKSALLSVRGSRSGGDECNAPPLKVLNRDDIERSVERSLRALKRSRLDILLVHEPTQFIIDETLKDCFQALLKDGTVGAFGLGYGHIERPLPNFGHVIQEPYEANSLADTSKSRLQIFHGVLRRDPNGSRRPRNAIETVLKTRPGASVIFSASSPSQISEFSA